MTPSAWIHYLNELLKPTNSTNIIDTDDLSVVKNRKYSMSTKIHKWTPIVKNLEGIYESIHE
jgi:hypothetical protein